LNISNHFFDVGFYWNLPEPYLISTRPVILMILIRVGECFYLVVSKSERRVWLLVVTLTFVILGILLPADLIRGGIRSVNSRYMIPCYLGTQISLAYLFTQVQFTIQLQKLWRVALVRSQWELRLAASMCQHTLGRIKTALILTSRSPAQSTKLLSH
jgi:uncharacterized membrane protein